MINKNLVLGQVRKKNLENLKKKVVKILKKNKVVRAGIFGSYARGEENKNSDIDILVEIKNKNISLLDFIKLEREIENALGKKIDLVEYKVIKSRIKEQILKEEIKII